MLAVSLVMSWYAYRAHRRAEIREAFDTLSAHGCFVTAVSDVNDDPLHWEYAGIGFDEKWQGDENDWHFVHCFPDVAMISCGSERLTDSTFEHLRQFKTLKRLDVERPSVDDVALSTLSGLKRLEDLQVTGPITDAGLDAVAELPHLHTLTLWDSEVSAKQMASHFASHSSLRLATLARARPLFARARRIDATLRDPRFGRLNLEFMDWLDFIRDLERVQVAVDGSAPASTTSVPSAEAIIDEAASMRLEFVIDGGTLVLTSAEKAAQIAPRHLYIEWTRENGEVKVKKGLRIKDVK